MYTDGDDVRTKLGEGEILLVAVRAASLVGGGGNGVHEAQINGWLAIAAMLGSSSISLSMSTVSVRGAGGGPSLMAGRGVDCCHLE
jgi:hypothetical protein